MSQWRYKTDAGDIGPVSFQELAALVREGKVSETTQVCRAGTMKWEPAWHVPGLFRAAGIVQEGDSPPVEAATERQREGKTKRGRDGGTEGWSETAMQRPTSHSVALSLLFSVVVGILAVGFFYRWASQTAMAFPMPPTEVEGELVNCYFPVLGRCTSLECGLLYLDVFAVAAIATWHAVGRRVAGG